MKGTKNWRREKGISGRQTGREQTVDKATVETGKEGQVTGRP